MSIPHHCVGTPCMICHPSQTIVGFAVPAVPGRDTSPVIDCNIARKIADPRDAEIAAQRAEIKRMCEERDSAQKCIEKLTARVADHEDDVRRVLAEECAPDERHCSCVPILRARVEKLEAVERAAREYRRRERTGGGCDIETTERLACAVEDARRVLDAALAAVEVQRG